MSQKAHRSDRSIAVRVPIVRHEARSVRVVRASHQSSKQSDLRVAVVQAVGGQRAGVNARSSPISCPNAVFRAARPTVEIA